MHDVTSWQYLYFPEFCIHSSGWTRTIDCDTTLACKQIKSPDGCNTPSLASSFVFHDAVPLYRSITEHDYVVKVDGVIGAFLDLEAISSIKEKPCTRPRSPNMADIILQRSFFPFRSLSTCTKRCSVRWSILIGEFSIYPFYYSKFLPPYRGVSLKGFLPRHLHKRVSRGSSLGDLSHTPVIHQFRIPKSKKIVHAFRHC